MCYGITVYTWHEGQGKRGGNEIGSCLWKWLEEKDKLQYKHIILYSDTCGGQTRNRIFCTALILFLNRCANIQTIEQKFFEAGHSQSEGDSMHSAIEQQFRNKKISLPSEYQTCMKSANKKKPYIVTELLHGDFTNFDKLNHDNLKGVAFEGIIKVHHILYTNVNGEVMVSFSEEIGGVMEEKSYRKRGQKINLKELELVKSYDGPLPITQRKKNDLLSLCQHIAQDCRLFYESLQV